LKEWIDAFGEREVKFKIVEEKDITFFSKGD
jgi:hypothetical protein